MQIYANINIKLLPRTWWVLPSPLGGGYMGGVPTRLGTPLVSPGLGTSLAVTHLVTQQVKLLGEGAEGAGHPQAEDLGPFQLDLGGKERGRPSAGGARGAAEPRPPRRGCRSAARPRGGGNEPRRRRGGPGRSGGGRGGPGGIPGRSGGSLSRRGWGGGKSRCGRGERGAGWSGAGFGGFRCRTGESRARRRGSRSATSGTPGGSRLRVVGEAGGMRGRPRLPPSVRPSVRPSPVAAVAAA